MGRLSKSTIVILIIVGIVSISLAGVFGYISGKRIADKENKRQAINDKVLEEKPKEEKKVCEVTANNDQEFVNYISSVNSKFKASECEEYIVNYSSFKFIAEGKSSIEYSGYNIEDIKLYYNDKQINIDVAAGESNFGYSNLIQTSLMTDGVNTLYVIILNLEPISNQPSSYVIAFNQNGEVLLNEENALKYYYIKTDIIDNNEVNELGVKYALVPETYGNDLLNVCSEGYLSAIIEYPEDTIVYSDTIFNYIDNNLAVIYLEQRTILEDKIFKGC